MLRINTLIGLTVGCFLAFGAMGCLGGGDDGGNDGGGTSCTADTDCADNT